MRWFTTFVALLISSVHAQQPFEVIVGGNDTVVFTPNFISGANNGDMVTFFW